LFKKSKMPHFSKKAINYIRDIFCNNINVHFTWGKSQQPSIPESSYNI
jgi:hypothetical protein